jgi:hypothetical protein
MRATTFRNLGRAETGGGTAKKTDRRSRRKAVMIFKPTPTQVYVGHVWSNPKNSQFGDEENHELYFDRETLEFFVVEEVAFGYPNGGCNHNTSPLRDYLARHPRRHDQLESLIRQGIPPDATS